MRRFRKNLLSLSFIALCSCGGGGGGSDSSLIDSNDTTSLALRSCGRENGPLKIMPLGDSITESMPGFNSYRRPLWRNLAQANCVIDFVGSKRGVSSARRDGPQIEPPNPDFDLDHEGHWDYRADEIARFVGNRIESFQPDIVLLHLGTNDILQGQSVDSTLDDLGAIIDAIRLAKPNTVIFLAKVIPSNRSPQQLAELNSKVDEFANAKQNFGSPLIVVDHASNYFVSDNHDGLHPGPSGEQKMGDKWTNAILQFIAERR